MKIKLSVGQVWRTRGDYEVTIVEYCPRSLAYSWRGCNGLTYNISGRVMSGYASESDLVELICIGSSVNDHNYSVAAITTVLKQKVINDFFAKLAIVQAEFDSEYQTYLKLKSKFGG